MTRRLIELDSIRGLAALTVMLCHYLNVMVSFKEDIHTNFYIWLLKYTPLHIIWAGHEAVILFFVLSGFVLFLSSALNETKGYPEYLIKRTARIYIPYFFAFLSSVLANVFFYDGYKEGLSQWFNNLWKVGFNQELLLQHIILLGSFENYVYNPVLWSLVHEMRISIIFPVITFIVIKLNWKFNITVAIFLSYIGVHFTRYYFAWSNDYLMTFHYIGMFIVGAILAKNINLIISFIKGLKFYYKLLILVGGTLFYTYPWWFMVNEGRFHSIVIDDWMITLGSVAFIIISLSSKKLSVVLKLKPIRFLGEISYSLYLVHFIVLLTMIHLFYSKVNLLLLLLFSAFLSLVLAVLFYYFVERPSIKLGKLIVNQYQEKVKKSKNIAA